MGKETKVGLLVGMCFIVCCAIVLSHHGRRRAEAQNLSATSAEQSREAPLLLDRNASAEKVTKRIAPKRTPRRTSRQMQRSDRNAEEGDTQLVDAGYSDDAPSNESAQDSGFERFGLRRNEAEDSNSRIAGQTAEPFIHRGPPIPDVVSPKRSSNRRDEEFVVLGDDVGDSGPLVANLPSRNRNGDMSNASQSDESASGHRRTLTSTPSPTPTRQREAIPSDSYENRANTSRQEHETKSPASDEPTRTAMDRHVVQDGENLSRIAERYYGSSAPGILDAIVKANHETMSGPNHIVSGQELLIPEIDGIDAIRFEDSDSVATSELRNNDEPKHRERIEDEVNHNDDASMPKALTEYEVRPGDLLSRIVSRHYGSASKELIDVVFAANRDRMRSPDRLEAGTVIVLPEIDGTHPKQHDAKPKRQDDAVAKNTKSEESFRWYEVKKGDTYSTIASAQMGTSRRWKELAEFNKDIFNDAKQIRHGAKIRIPKAKSQDHLSRNNHRSQ